MSGSAAPELYDDAYFAGPMAEWHRCSLPTFAAFVAEAAAGRPPGRVLDLGCGGGAYAPVLRPLASELVGCDAAPAALARAAAGGGYDRLIEHDLDTAEAADLGGPYDLVFSTEVIEHLRDPARFLALVEEVLAPGGRLVLTTTAYHFYVFYYLGLVRPIERAALADWLAGWRDPRRADRFVARLWQVTGGHTCGFSRRRLRVLAQAAGLRVVRLRHAQVQPVAPVEHLRAPPGAGLAARAGWRAVAAAGRAANALCRATGLYGANLLLAADRPAPPAAEGPGR
jgi:SAM-dependent methyltransferase